VCIRGAQVALTLVAIVIANAVVVGYFLTAQRMMPNMTKPFSAHVALFKL
jgi:hypothetical protein